METETKPSQDLEVFAFGSCEVDQFLVVKKDAEGNEKVYKDANESKSAVNLTQFLRQHSLSVHSVACGALHTLLLTTNGRVFSFGCNDDGALGRSGDEKTPLPVELSHPVDMISAGDSHSIACNSVNSYVYYWGIYRTTAGNMSTEAKRVPERIGETEFNRKPITKILSGSNHTLVLTEGRVYAWGDPETQVLGRMPLARRKVDQALRIEALGLKNVEDVFTGGYHSFCKVLVKKKGQADKTEIYAWGLNNYGQLGIGNTKNTYTPTLVEAFVDKPVKKITGGEHHTIALLESGEVYAFGRDDDGQLGLGEDFKEEREPEEEKPKKQPKPAKKSEKKSEKKKGKGSSKSKAKEGDKEEEGEKAEGEKAEGEKAEGEKAEGEKAEGEKKEEGEGEKKTEEGEGEKKTEEGEKKTEGEAPKDENKMDEEKKEDEKKDENKMEEEAKPEAEAEAKAEEGDAAPTKEFKYVCNPQKVAIEKVKNIFSKGNYNYCVTEDNTLYSWGSGDLYVLGTRKEESEYTPYKVNPKQFNEMKVIDLGLGSQHVVFLAISDPNGERPNLDESVLKKIEEEKSAKKSTAARGKSKGAKKDEGEETKDGEADEKAEEKATKSGQKSTRGKKKADEEEKVEGKASEKKGKAMEEEKTEEKSASKRSVNGRKRGAPTTNDELTKEVEGGSTAKKGKVTKGKKK